MSVVAVAGGTGQLGRSIVETLLENGNYKVIILTRKANQVAQEEIGAPVIPLNYGNVDDITSVLEAYNVHTLISTIVTINGTEPELNLIKAADKSATTKRFVPSYWATDYPAEFRDTFFVAKNKFEALDALESTSLEYTTFIFGYFLDYFVAPHIKSHLYPTALYIDAANNTAAVPGSGDVMNQFIYSLDVARFVVAALSLPKWEKKSFIIGDRITWNQFVTSGGSERDKIQGIP
ncbi:hypothetical protein FDECE_2613 [Fusarium decemcellulare]|nr:hypothetical protein FDECE_2613 [Fusarium decemcellulare]